VTVEFRQQFAFARMAQAAGDAVAYAVPGMFAALGLIKLGEKGAKIVVYEKGEVRTGSGSECSITCGWGGSGAYSDGKLNHTVESGGQLKQHLSPEEAEKLIQYVDG